jgi:hypothetical protein
MIPLNEMWVPEKIIENINLLRSQMKWKNLKLTYDELSYSQKGYFVVHFSYDEPERKSSIIIYRDKVEITSNNWSDNLLAIVILSKLLSEGQTSIFLESLYKDFKEKGEFNSQFNEMFIEVLKSQYIDLIEGKVPKKLLEITKENVRLTLETMIKAIEDID